MEVNEAEMAEMFGDLAGAVQGSPTVDELWEAFGTYRHLELSPRPGEFACLVISEEEREYALSFQLPFDRDGGQAGPARIVAETRSHQIAALTLNDDLSRRMHAEVAGEIRAGLPHLRPMTVLDEGYCRVNHRVWRALLSASAAEVAAAPAA